MSKLKNSLGNITDDTEAIARDYFRLWSIRQTEKMALFLGILFSSVLIAILLLIAIVLCSIALAGYLNKVLDSQFWGYVIMASSYLLVIALLVVKIRISKTPPFANLFVKLMVMVFGMQIDQSQSIEGLKNEEENLQTKIDAGKIKIKSEVQLLRYSLLEGLINEFFSLFSRRKKSTSEKPATEKTAKKKTSKKKAPKKS
jgi:hypothetical protein